MTAVRVFPARLSAEQWRCRDQDRLGPLFPVRWEVVAVIGEYRRSLGQPPDAALPLVCWKGRVEQAADLGYRIALDLTRLQPYRSMRFFRRCDLQADLHQPANRVGATHVMRLGPGIDRRRQAL